jgi:hypothetical protein
MRTTSISKTSFLATIPIFLFGISWLLEYTEVNKTICNTFLICSITSMFILFAIGWVKNFPKWTIHSIGFCILISIYLMDLSIPKWTGGNLLGLLGLLPLLVTLLISLILHFSLQPIKQLLNKISKEKNILIFIFYGFLPVMFMFEFDEIYHISVIPITIILTLLTALSVIIYLNSSKKLISTITLIFGIIITNSIAITASTYICNNIMK